VNGQGSSPPADERWFAEHYGTDESGVEVPDPAGAAGADDDSDRARSERPVSQASELLRLAEEWDLFHAPGGDAYAAVVVDDHRETWPIGSRAWRQYLSAHYYQLTGRVPGEKALQDASTTLAGRASFSGDERPVFVRIAHTEGAIYVDLGDPAWRAVEIGHAGWKVVARPPVHFRRPGRMRPLPEPAPGGRIEELRGFVNVDDDGFILILAWLVQALRGRGPNPVLVLNGEQGTAKSTTAWVLRALVDPGKAPLRSQPRNEHDLVIAAESNWVIALDNLSGIPVWLSDALCRLATGGGFSTRRLYTDADEIIFDATRPILLNGITEIATRADLLDRSLVISLPVIPDEQRRVEDVLFAEFEQARPRLLGSLFDAVACALARVCEVRLERPPRLADFARWVTAAEPALGYSAGTFDRVFTGNRAAAHELTLSASPIVEPIVALADEGFVGTATELLDTLSRTLRESSRAPKGWPSAPQVLSGELRRLAPSLRANDVSVEFDRKPGRRTITIEKRPAGSVMSVISVIGQAPGAAIEPDHDADDADDASSRNIEEDHRAGLINAERLEPGADGYADERPLEVEPIYARRFAEGNEPASAPCRYAAHRIHDWLNEAGWPVCGVCHPRVPPMEGAVA
jgi:hypothetical protein